MQLTEPSEESTDSAEDDDDSCEEGRNAEDEVFEESWHEWICRATHVSEAAAAKFNVTDWVREQRIRKFNLAGHTARRHDGR
eukprot:398683-Karenia_brevis.AAC.1